LFFHSGESFAGPLQQHLLKDNSEVIEVIAGEQYEKISEKRYVISPAELYSVAKLFDSVGNDGIDITDIIYSWGMSVDSSKLELKEGNDQLTLVYFGLTEIVKVLLGKNALSRKRIAILTASLQRVTGAENIKYAQSLLSGLVNVLPVEYFVECCSIDIDLQEQPDKYAGKLADEINHNPGGRERFAALRNGQRWVQEYQKNVWPVGNKKNVIRKNGVYLITGGLGNTGFVLAKHLISNYDACVILTGRKHIGGNGNDKQEGLGKAAGRLRLLKGMSSKVHYLSSDIADAESLKNAVEHVEYSFGAINGVIHTAGIIDNNALCFELVADNTWEKVQQMFAPKVNGIMNIYKVFKKRNPDFVWITSSLATVLGGAGYAAYSSANLFMDHFIDSKKDELGNWKCIGLAEMAFDGEDELFSLKPDEIVSFFEWSLSVDDVPVILETIEDLALRIGKKYDPDMRTAIGDAGIGEVSEKRMPRPEVTAAFTGPETKTEIILQRMVKDFFGFCEVGVEDNFFELGGDSLKAMVLLRRINKEFGVTLSIKDFMDNVNMRSVASKIDEKIWLTSDVTIGDELDEVEVFVV
jgi:phthiocerol/phenolphthiocerol synthesis type-I polyketide synthase E